MEFCVVIPSYNEEKNIEQTIMSIPEYVNHIYVVNDGSDDRTLEILNSLDSGRITILKHNKNMGKGKALITAFTTLKNDERIDLKNCIIVLMDGDGQMDPDLIEELAQPIINDECKIVKGSRFLNKDYTRNMPGFRKFGNQILKYLNRISTGYWNISDPQSGYFLIKGDVLRSLNLETLDRGYYVENSFLHQFMSAEQKIIERPIEAIYDVGEISTINYFEFIPSTSLKLFWHWNMRLASLVNKSIFRSLAFLFLLTFYLGLFFSIITSISPFLDNSTIRSYFLPITILSIFMTFIFDYIHYKIHITRN